MSGSSPADLAIAFRSLERRLGGALEPVGGDRSVVASELSELDQIVASAAGILRTAAEPGAIAAALEDRPADAWADGELDQLRELGLRLGRQVRAIEAAAEAAAPR